MNKRILALDIGDARIGIAVSDPGRIIASPVEVLHRVGWGPDTRRIIQLCNEYETDEILSGLPLNMDGTEGFQAKKVRDFCAQLEKSGLKVYYQDERLSTVTAEDALLEDNMSRSGRKGTVDKIAAAVILRQWLDEQNCMNTDMEEHPMTNENETNSMNPEDEGYVTLVDENGEETRFDHLATVELDENYYLILADPAAEDEDEQEVFILKIDSDEDGNEVYTPLEDDDLADRVFEVFTRMLDDVDGEEE